MRAKRAPGEPAPLLEPDQRELSTRPHQSPPEWRWRHVDDGD